MVCFYIISYTSITCITTVYRSYGANGIAVQVLVAIRVKQVVAFRSCSPLIHGSNIEVAIARIGVDTARSQPPTTIPYKVYIIKLCRNFSKSPEDTRPSCDFILILLLIIIHRPIFLLLIFYFLYCIY